MVKFIFIYILTLIVIFVDHYKFLKNEVEFAKPTLKDLFKVHWTVYVPVLNTTIVVVILLIDLVWKILKKN